MDILRDLLPRGDGQNDDLVYRAWLKLLGSQPKGNSTVLRPKEWPKSAPGRWGLHAGLFHLLVEEAKHQEVIDPEALADQILWDLEEGLIPTAVVDDVSGEMAIIPRARWRGAKARALMLWTGRAVEYGTDGKSEKVRRCQGDIFIFDELLVPPEAQPLDLEDSVALCRLLLHLAGRKSAGQIAANSVGSDFAVSESSVSRFLKRAREILAEKGQ